MSKAQIFLCFFFPYSESKEVYVQMPQFMRIDYQDLVQFLGNTGNSLKILECVHCQTQICAEADKIINISNTDSLELGDEMIFPFLSDIAL